MSECFCLEQYECIYSVLNTIMVSSTDWDGLNAKGIRADWDGLNVKGLSRNSYYGHCILISWSSSEYIYIVEIPDVIELHLQFST